MPSSGCPVFGLSLSDWLSSVTAGSSRGLAHCYGPLQRPDTLSGPPLASQYWSIAWSEVKMKTQSVMLLITLNLYHIWVKQLFYNIVKLIVLYQVNRSLSGEYFVTKFFFFVFVYFYVIWGILIYIFHLKASLLL